jgi:hypothetical protein
LTPARAGLKAVAVPQGRNIQAGTAIFKRKRFYTMSSKLILTLACAAVAVSSACSTAAPNANTAANTNVSVTLDANSMPPGLSTSPLPPSSNSTPGIPPANQVAVAPKGGTPTPGIPDPKMIGKPLKPGATPTPGIPDPETLRRQMNQRVTNVNVNTPPAGPNNDGMMMSRKKRAVPVPTPQ